MKFRAIARASERSNAVGTVELECTAHGLVVVYLGVGAFAQGYAPGALTVGTRVDVPWAAVTNVELTGDELYLAFDPALSPHNRLTLGNFSTGTRTHHHELYRRRMVLRVAALGFAVAGALIASATVPKLAPRAGASLALGVAGFTAALVLLLGFLAERSLALGGADGEAALQAFCAELSRFFPALIRGPKPAPKPRGFGVAMFQGLLPRTTMAIVITLTACTLGLALTARWLVLAGDPPRRASLDDDAETTRLAAPRPAAQPLPATTQHSAPTAARDDTPAPPPATGDGVRLGADCRCPRSDSVLWSEPIPRLSVLVLSQKVRRGRGEDEKKRKKYLELDIAVVNNSNEELREVALLVDFFDRDPPPSSKRYPVSNRPLFFEGPLRPGQAIKWSVEAEGSEFEVQNPFKGDIGPHGDDAAPTNLLVELLSANHRPVRLHGAMMLAFMNDPRAREGILELREALREDEAPYLTRLLQALNDVRVCRLDVPEHGRDRPVSACVFNAAREPRKDLGLKLRALATPVSHSNPTAPPPEVLAERAYQIPGELAPNTGKLVSFSFGVGDSNPGAFEAFADRYDLLPR